MDPRSERLKMKYENQFSRISNLSHTRQKVNDYGFIGESQFNKIQNTGSARCLTGNWFEEQCLKDAMKDISEEERENTFHSVMKKNMVFTNEDEAKKVNVQHHRPKSKATVAMGRDGKWVTQFMENENDQIKKILPRNALSTPYLIGNPRHKKSHVSTHMDEYKVFKPESGTKSKRKQLMEKILMQKVIEEEMGKLEELEAEKRRLKDERNEKVREENIKKATPQTSTLHTERQVSFESQRMHQWRKDGIVSNDLPQGYFGRSSFFSKPKNGM